MSFPPQGTVLARDHEDFWSDVEDSVTIPAVAADLDFPSVVVSGATGGWKKVVALLK